MTDQPETMDEYRYRKLHNLIKTSTHVIAAVVLAVGAGVTHESDPAMAAAFAAPLVLGVVFIIQNLRKTIERPEQPQEVPADD